MNCKKEQAGISKRMQSLLQQAQSEGWADRESSIAIRDGRMVIPIPSAYKRKINGIVHDESATGKTSYIEPTEIVETNNEIRELELEEKGKSIASSVNSPMSFARISTNYCLHTTFWPISILSGQKLLFPII